MSGITQNLSGEEKKMWVRDKVKAVYEEVKTAKLDSLLYARLMEQGDFLSNLMVLWLNGCDLPQCLPPSFCRLRKLKVLTLEETTLGELPYDFGQLSSLREVNFSGCKRLVYLPVSIGGLSNLSKLELNGCELLSKLPASLCRLKMLEALRVEKTALEELPYDFGQLTRLTELHLSGCKSLKRLADSFGVLSNLSEFFKLSMNGCELFSKLPASFCRLTNLRVLRLEETALGELPDDFGQLSSLREVNFSGCKRLVHLPESFGNLSKLEKLWMNGCERLFMLPASFCGLTNLEAFSLVGLDSIGQLPA